MTLSPFDYVRLAYVLAVTLALVALIVAFVRGRKFDWGVWRVLAAAGILILAFSACTPAQPTPLPSAPPPPACTVNVTNNGDGNVNVNGCVTGATPSPSPSPGGASSGVCAEMHAFIASFGWSGPVTSTRPNNQAQPYPLCKDCQSLLTATLKTPQGDAPLNVSSGKGRPEWTVDPLGVLDITTDQAVTSIGGVAQLNNSDGYNLLVKPIGSVGSTATVKLKFNASCIGDPVTGEFKYSITAN